jgi:uncharacterized protein (DUF2062 family)
MKILARLKEETKKITLIEDTPHAVALGSAMGVLFGITPLFGIKMPLAIALSFIARGNVIATLVLVGIADILLPVMTFVYFAEYKLGCLLLALKAHAPSMDLIDDAGEIPHWAAIASKGLPLLVGSLALGAIAAIPVYAVVKAILDRKKIKGGKHAG